ncbi:NAD(P)-binding domain-containing protein, partial [Candidatus Peregrinibacteria bacterium]|nr:NAD(P)-binding domain-containing protein [Candidatus Peregrinibacteria bacterium]
MTSNLGLIGLGTMGKSLARNIASRGFSLSLWNRTTEKINEFVDEFPDENFYAPQSFEDFVESIERPRRIILMVPAGDPTADLIKKLAS